MISSISPESALRFSGRFIVTTRVWSTSSTRACDWALEGVGHGAMLAKNKNVF